MLKHFFLLAVFIAVTAKDSITAQTTNESKISNSMKNTPGNTNPLLCDPETGFCEVPGSNPVNTAVEQKLTKPIKLLYFTDPICSSCWGIEPQLRKLKLEYGDVLEVEYHMGGLLPDWSYNSGGISKPSDVAHHWDEVSLYYDMPIDGDIWLEDPLHSSYPPSIAFKAAQLQDKKKAINFLRELREQVFLQKKNITKWEHVVVAAQRAGLDTAQLNKDMEARAKQLFEEDLQLARQYGVRGFPTLFFINAAGAKEIVYGTKPYEIFETAIQKLHPVAGKAPYPNDWNSVFRKYHSLTAKEFSVLTGVARSESEAILDQLAQSGKLEKLTTKNGSLWKLKE